MRTSVVKLLVLGLLVMVGFREVSAFDHSHTSWDSLLREHVSGGLVDYQSLLGDEQRLDQYLSELDSISRKEVDGWNRREQLAFWINAYNAFTVRVILDHYPIDTWTFKGLVVPRNSIIQIPGVWKKLSWKVAGQLLTLDQIEHSIIRPNFDEPRIHFSIVCASIGCPDLRSEAFTPSKLESQLQEQAVVYMRNTSKGVRFDFEEKRICVSQIFKWFTKDFVIESAEEDELPYQSGNTKLILSFIKPYFPDEESQALFMSKDLDFDYLSYDWSLNDFPKTDEKL